MNQQIKSFGVLFLTLFLSYCQDGPVGRRASQFGLVNPQAQTGLSQTGKSFSSPTSPMLPLNFLQALSMQPQEFAEPTEPAIESIDYTNAVNSRAACLGNGDIDSDKDGLPDDCGLEHFPYTYNGWLVGGRYFDSKDPRLTLTADENAEWKRDSAERGGIGFGNISGHAQKLVKKFSALKQLSDSDMGPLREIFYSYSQQPIRISDSFRSYERSDAFQSSQYDDANLGLAAGDGEESIPYDHTKPATNVAGLTAFGKDTDSYREQGRFKMIVYDTNVVIPKNSNSLQVTIGHLSNQNFVMPPRTGMYYVINNGDSILLQNELLSDKGQEFQGSRFGTIYRNTGCTTSHLTIVYITDGSYDRRGQAILPEVVAFRASDKDPWTTLSQEYFSIQPQGGIECQQGFAANDVKNEKTFFKTSTNINRRVPGVIDFNTSLGSPGIANPNKMLDASSTSIELIKEASTDKPVSKMTAAETYEYEKALFQLEKSALPSDDQKWLDDEFKAIEDRKKALNQGKVVGEQFTQLDQLNKKLATIDQTSPEYAPTVAKIDEIIKALGDPAASLTEDQKKALADQTAAYNTRKTAIQTPAVNPKAITVSTDKDATIPLSADDLSKLKELGYVFKDAQGNEIPAGQAVKLTPAQLDSILAQSADELGKGKLDQPKAKALSGLLDSLKKNKKVDAKKIDQFKKDNGSQIASAMKGPKSTDPNMVTFDPDGTIKLTPKDMIRLKDLGFTFTDENGNPYDPVPNPGKNKKITEDQFSDIMKRLGEKLEANDFDAAKKQSPKDVESFLTSMKKSGADAQNIDDFLAQHEEKISPMPIKWSPEQVAALTALDADTSKAKPGLTEDLKKWSKGFPDQVAADAAKKTALEKIEKSLLDPTKADFTTQEREAVVDDLKKVGLVGEEKAEELKTKIGARAAFVDANGNYHPEYAFLITLVKAARPDGTTFTAFKFNSTINFDTGSSKVDANGENVINGFLNFVKTVKENAKIADTYFRIEAFTDATGSKEKNQQVSDSRAQTVKEYLVEKTQTPEDHVISVGKGIDPEALKGPKVNGRYKPDIRFRRVEITFSAEPFTPKVPS